MLSLQEAYELATSGGGVVVARPGRGLVRLTGPQRTWFLQSTVSADVEAVEPGRWVESCFLTPKGKVVAHFRVGVGDQELWLDVDEGAAAELVGWFVRYRFRTKVEVEDCSTAAFTVLGEAAEQIAPPGTVAAGGRAFGDRLGTVPCTDLHAPPPPGLPLGPEELYDVLRLEAGRPRFGVDYGPDTLPQEAGLAHTISVTKGCYVGQEVMARLHFRGHVNRVLRPLRLCTDLDPPRLAGRGLLHGAERVGAVTSAARSPRAGVVGLGMVRATLPAGEVLGVEGDGTASLGPVPPGTKVEATPRRLG